jgi:predicted RNA-binding Zn-ribbon protein involved in translation (DUF1610 family)
MDNYQDPPPDCTEPAAGVYLAFEGEVVANCPDCGQEKALRVDIPTNRLEFLCPACGREYVVWGTLTPAPELN